MDYLYILATILSTVYGLLIIKWRVAHAGDFPVGAFEKVGFLSNLILSPWVISGLVAGFLAFLFWVIAMTKFELSVAYPFTSLTFLFVLVLSGAIFHEAITIHKVLGVAFIVAGIIIGSRG